MSKKLWKHQAYALDKYKGRKFFGLLFDMGLGKTFTTIRIAEEKEKPVLIIAPNALCDQWKNDIEADSSKDWNVVLCTSKTRKTKKYKTDFDNLIKEC